MGKLAFVKTSLPEGAINGESACRGDATNGNAMARQKTNSEIPRGGYKLPGRRVSGAVVAPVREGQGYCYLKINNFEVQETPVQQAENP